MTGVGQYAKFTPPQARWDDENEEEGDEGEERMEQDRNEGCKGHERSTGPNMLEKKEGTTRNEQKGKALNEKESSRKKRRMV